MDFQYAVATRTLWQEARGEPPEGQAAVAHVLWNRVRSGRWGKTLAEVCLYHHQFSAWGPVVPSSATMLANFAASCRLADNDPFLLAAAKLLDDTTLAPDPTGGATHYYADSIPAPAWAAQATACGKFGRQLFFRNVP